MQVGYMGDVVFVCSEMNMLTPSGFQRSGDARWHDHDIIGAKPASEFLGEGLGEISFDLILSSRHGIDPDEQAEELREMMGVGAVFPLVIGGKPVSQGQWRITGLSEQDNYYDADGKRIWCKMSVKLKEYDDSNAAEEDARDALHGGGGGKF